MTLTRPELGKLAEIAREVLLEHLDRAGAHWWPGVDGMNLEDLLQNYAAAVAGGRAPGREQLLAAYPELAAELDVFFATHPTPGRG